MRWCKHQPTHRKGPPFRTKKGPFGPFGPCLPLTTIWRTRHAARMACPTRCSTLMMTGWRERSGRRRRGLRKRALARPSMLKAGRRTLRPSRRGMPADQSTSRQITSASVIEMTSGDRDPNYMEHYNQPGLPGTERSWADLEITSVS
jgi:hypothetical protein